MIKAAIIITLIFLYVGIGMGFTSAYARGTDPNAKTVGEVFSTFTILVILTLWPALLISILVDYFFKTKLHKFFE